MRKYKEFPYPSKDELIVAYGRKGCPYCDKIKIFMERIKKKLKESGNNGMTKLLYHDIFDIIDSGAAEDVSDFRKKMRVFVGNYSMVPIIFINGNFVGGYTDFCNTMITLFRVDKEYGNSLYNSEIIKLKKFSDKNINEIKRKLKKKVNVDKCDNTKKNNETKNKKSK